MSRNWPDDEPPAGVSHMPRLRYARTLAMEPQREAPLLAHLPDLILNISRRLQFLHRQHGADDQKPRHGRTNVPRPGLRQ